MTATTQLFFALLTNHYGLQLETERFPTVAELRAYLDKCKARGYVEGTVTREGETDWTEGDELTIPFKTFGSYSTEIMDGEAVQR